MAAWKADFDMSFGGDSSRRPATASKKAALEAGKQEVRNKVSRALQKLCDRDTQQGAIDELQRTCRELKPEHASVVISQLLEFENAKNAYARSNAARLFGIVVETQFTASRKSIGKIVEVLCSRMRDLDTSVRESCAETVGEIARLVCAVDTGPSGEETVDLDSSVVSVSILNDDKNPSLDLVFRPLFQAMSSADNNQQQGCALALAHVLFKVGKKMDPFLETVSKRILEKMDSTHFSGRPQLLNAIANIIEVYPEGIISLIRYYLPRVFNAAVNSDWNTRKHAMETIETIAARLDPGCLSTFKSDICAIVEKNKFDKVKPVRDAALQAYQTLSSKNMFDRDQDLKPERSATITETPRHQRHDTPRAQDENRDESQAREFPSFDSNGSNAVPTTPRVPMQPLHNTAVNRPGTGNHNGSKADHSGDFSAGKLHASHLTHAFPHDHNNGTALFSGSQSAGPGLGADSLPSKDTWEKLLMHFDRMTQQQTQLIEMVSTFSDSARERLETVEQKVFALELRLASMENRQSLPGMPPTPSRAVLCGTPAAAALVAKMNPCPEEPNDSAALDSDFCP